MAAFATPEAAETRAKAKMLDYTWVVAHAAKDAGGTVCVRVQRYVHQAGAGAWVEITDDATV